MFDKRFWIAALERAIKTAAQAGVIYVGASQVSAWEFNWIGFLGYAIMGFVLSVMTSIVSANFGSNPGPSLADETIEPDPILVEVEVPRASARSSKKPGV